MNKLLHIKHYILFLIFILPWPLAIYEMLNVTFPVTSNFSISHNILGFLSTSIIILWFYTVGVNLYEKVKIDANLSITFFKFCIIFISINLLFSYSFDYFGFLPYAIFSSNWLISILFAFNLFSILFSVYCVVFLSKSLICAESDYDPTFSYYWREFLAIWLFPIGIWWLQPRIQIIFEDDNSI